MSWATRVTNCNYWNICYETWYWSRVLSNNLEKQIKIYGQSLLKTDEKESKYSVVVFLLFMFIKIIAHVKE